MRLIIKSFRQILKQQRGKDKKPRSKRVCYKCGKLDHFIAKCPNSSDSDKGDDKKGKKKEKKRYYKKKGGDAHVCREWDSDESSTDSSSDEDAANIAINKGLLFPNVGHKCFMAKDDKKEEGTIVGVLGPTAHLGLPLKVFFRSRMVLPTVARWFVQGARETVNNDIHVRAA
jgi:hypothetical protein